MITLANCFEGKEIQELGYRNESGANIIGLQKAGPILYC